MTASAATHAVFFFFLFFWQRLRRLLCFTPAMVFLDRLCIAQKDEHLKQEGISASQIRSCEMLEMYGTCEAFIHFSHP